MKNKSLIIGGIVLSLVIVLSIGTYAYWTITRSQETANTLLGGCLKIEMEDASAGISLEKAWPISDFEGMQLEGYTFTVTNECEEPQDYRIDLDRLVDSEGRKEMSNDYLATLLDYGVPVMYEELEPGETTDEEVKEKRVLAYDTVAGKVGDTPGSNTHTLRLWIDEESPVSEQGSTFLSRVEINAGQGIEKYYTPEECFAFDSSTGSITSYDVSCGGTDVVIPYEINDVAVTRIGGSVFEQKGITSVELSRTITYLDDYAVAGNPDLTKVIFKDGLKSIGLDVFYCYNSANEGRCALSFVNLPNTLEGKLEYTFYYNSLKHVIVPEGVTSLEGTFAFNQLEEVKLNNNIIEILSESFIENELKEIVIPDSVELIDSVSFSHNPLEEIKFGTGLIEIGNNAFSNHVMSTYKYFSQNFLKEVYIPKNVTKMGISVFASATSDVTIYVDNPKSAINASSAWWGHANVVYAE